MPVRPTQSWNPMTKCFKSSRVNRKWLRSFSDIVTFCIRFLRHCIKIFRYLTISLYISPGSHRTVDVQLFICSEGPYGMKEEVGQSTHRSLVILYVVPLLRPDSTEFIRPDRSTTILQHTSDVDSRPRSSWSRTPYRPLEYKNSLVLVLKKVWIISSLFANCSY